MVIYHWAKSQICQSCKHGIFVSELCEGVDIAMICSVDCEMNDGVSCPEFIPKEDE